MSDHDDPLCPFSDPLAYPRGYCLCEHNARVRADERAKREKEIANEDVMRQRAVAWTIARIQAAVEADRDALSAKIDGGLMDGYDVEQIDQWACERVALNRVLAMIDKMEQRMRHPFGKGFLSGAFTAFLVMLGIATMDVDMDNDGIWDDKQ